MIEATEQWITPGGLLKPHWTLVIAGRFLHREALENLKIFFNSFIWDLGKGGGCSSSGSFPNTCNAQSCAKLKPGTQSKSPTSWQELNCLSHQCLPLGNFEQNYEKINFILALWFSKRKIMQFAKIVSFCFHSSLRTDKIDTHTLQVVYLGHFMFELVTKNTTVKVFSQ